MTEAMIMSKGVLGGLVLLFCSATTGCVKQMMLNGQISATREASAAIDTLSDFEIARGIAYAGLGQLEGMHHLANENEDALFMLTKGWTSAAFGFIEDDYELADGVEDEALADYHRSRARAAYDRAIQYGTLLLEKHRKGFDKAKINDGSLRTYLRDFGQEQAAVLLWVGQASLAKVNMSKDDPAAVADLFVGVALVERSVELDERLAYGQGLASLGAYHARTAMAELDESARAFQRAFRVSGSRALLPLFHYARTYLCMKGDKAAYEKTLHDIVSAGDLLPEQRIQNTIAKRRARRYLALSRESSCGF